MEKKINVYLSSSKGMFTYEKTIRYLFLFLLYNSKETDRPDSRSRHAPGLIPFTEISPSLSLFLDKKKKKKNSTDEKSSLKAVAGFFD